MPEKVELAAADSIAWELFFIVKGLMRLYNTNDGVPHPIIAFYLSTTLGIVKSHRKAPDGVNCAGKDGKL